MPVSSGAFPVKFLTENTLSEANNCSPRRTISGPLGKREPQVSYIHSIMGCLQGRGPGSGPPCFQLLGFFLTPSNHSGGREELNVQGLPEESERTDGNGVLHRTTEPRNCTDRLGNQISWVCILWLCDLGQVCTWKNHLPHGWLGLAVMCLACSMYYAGVQ